MTKWYKCLFIVFMLFINTSIMAQIAEIAVLPGYSDDQTAASAAMAIPQAASENITAKKKPISDNEPTAKMLINVSPPQEPSKKTTVKRALNNTRSPQESSEKTTVNTALNSVTQRQRPKSMLAITGPIF